MATKIRLQRHGRKARAIYHIVVADSRKKRDGKFIEKLGLYNPNNDPAFVDLNFDSAVKWVASGAEISDTARSILSKEGVLLRNHLDGGISKGALSQEEADAKFEAWKKEKGAQSDAAAKSIVETELKAKKEALAAETKIKEEREAASAAKLSELQVAEAPAEEVVAEAPAEEVVAEAPAEEVVAEAPTEEVVAEAPAEEVVAEAPAEESTEKTSDKSAE
jgi:small subunit ribosomal protein S16